MAGDWWRRPWSGPPQGWSVGRLWLAAGLLLALFSPVARASGEARGYAAGGEAGSGAARPSVSSTAGDTAEKSAPCGKCHNSCEQGKVHEGVLPAASPAVAALPLAADGTATCLTCHAPHAGEVGAGARLRVPNLRRELCLSCHRAGDVGQPGVEIVSPPERAILTESRVALIGRAAGLDGALLTVRLNGSAFHLHARAGRFFTWLTLQPGVNAIEVAREGRTLWAGEVFRSEGPPDRYGRTTSGHCTGRREECLGCHDGEGDGVARVRDDASPLCYACHDRLDAKRYLHGPIAVGSCLACHDPHAGYGATHLRREGGALCRSCHDTGGEGMADVCASRGRECTACHDPHQSDARYLLKGPQYTLRDAGAGAAR